MRGLLVTSFVGVCLVACGATTTSSQYGDASTATGDATPGTIRHEPAVHRPTASTCGVTPPRQPAPPPPGSPDSGTDAGAPAADGTCTTDTDCPDYAPDWKGHCRSFDDAGGAKKCNFDGCFVDADCGATGVCSCQGQTYGFGRASPGNRCVASNCRVDTDCGAGGWCSPTASPDCGWFYGTQGWYCHTATDECSDDADCPPNGGSPLHCSYRPEIGHWKCESGACAG
jgi:hypothetical protein